MEQAKKIFGHSKVKIAIYILGGVAVALVIFQAGMYVGFKKAGLSFRTGEEYFRQMNGRTNDPFMGMGRSDFVNSHGAIGKIISIKLPTIIVIDRDGAEKTITVSTSTDIRIPGGSIKPEDLKVNDFIVAIGDSDDTKAEVEAKFIRIMPDPSKNMPADMNSAVTNK